MAVVLLLFGLILLPMGNWLIQTMVGAGIGHGTAVFLTYFVIALSLIISILKFLFQALWE